MLRLEHIFKTYYVGDEVVHALDDASLHVRPKEYQTCLMSVFPSVQSSARSY